MNHMNHWMLASICASAIVSSSRIDAAPPQEKESVTVAFGAGLNTATPNNPANHHVLPRVIEVKAGGVVSFAVSGFHQIVVYVPGVKVEDVQVPASGTFIDDLVNVYYKGILPAGGPAPGIPATLSPSNATNRVESVSFGEPGLYLVICNVRTHFNDGMYAYVRVIGATDTAPRH